MRKMSSRLARVQPSPAASLKRRFNLWSVDSSTDALIDLVVWCRLPCQIPVWLALDALTGLRITVLPQRWPACRGQARRLGIYPDVIQYLPDIGAARDESNNAHLATTQGA